MVCKNIQERFHPVITLTLSVSHLEGGQHLIRFLVGTGGNGVAGVAVRVNDRVSSLPADDDGPFSPRRAVELLHVTLLRHGGVGVTGDHGRDWAGETERTMMERRQRQKERWRRQVTMAAVRRLMRGMWGGGRGGEGGGGDGIRRRGAAGC